MDTWQIILIFIVIIGLPVLGTVVKRLAVGRARVAGAQRLGSKIDNEAVSLAGVIDLQADQARAAAVVTDVLGTRKRWSATAPAEWTFKKYSDDDLIVRLVPTPTGSRLFVVRTIDVQGRPQHVKEWSQVREAVTAAATAQGIGVGVAQHPALQRVEVPATNTPFGSTWVLPGS